MKNNIIPKTIMEKKMKVNKDYFCEHCGKRIPYSTNKQGLTNHKYNISKNTVKK